MKVNFTDLKAQYKEYQKEIDNEVLEVLNSAEFTDGEKVKSFEHSLSIYTGSKHAIGCSSGTDALLLSLMALDIGAGDEVITTPFTFVATAEVIALLGAKTVFVDIDKESYNIDASKIEAVVTPQTKAIIAVSLFGQCADMDAINDIAKVHSIAVIEDASQSFGATYNDKKSCNLSTIGCTSFSPSEPLGGYGDGGAIFTNDDEIANKIRMLINHGQSEMYKYKHIGINAHLDTIQAAILGVKLKHFDKEVILRDHIGSRYSDLLEDSDVVTPKISDFNTSVYTHYSIRVKDREKMIEKLKAQDIETAIYYPIALHLQETFKNLGYHMGDFPISEEVSSEIMSLPMSPYLSDEKQDFIVDAIKS